MACFLESLAINTRLAGSLRARQIDQVELGDSLHVLTQLLGLNLDDEDAVRTSTGVVLGCLAHHPVGVTNEEQVEGVLLALSTVHGKVFEHKLSCLVLLNLDLGQVHEVLAGVVLVQEVVAVVVVDLQVAHIDVVAVGGSLLYTTEDVA